jgi:hypothetical protein
MVDEYDEDLAQARTMVSMLDPLLKSEGWKFYQQMIDKQIAARMQVRPEASDGFGAVFEKEFKSGEVSGLFLSRTLAQGALDAAKTLLIELQEEKVDDK